MYYDAIEKYKEDTEIIILSDSRLETDWSFVDKLKNMGVILHTTDRRGYETLATGLINENQYKVIMPTQYDIFQHIYGFDTFSKLDIYNKLNCSNIRTPKVYSRDLVFPLIAKPVNGAGGHGVKKLHDMESLTNFVTNKPYDYIDFGKGYQFEEYVAGPSVSLTCCKINNESRFLSIYDMEYDDEYFVTTGRSYPSKFSKLFSDTTLDKILNFVDINVPNNGFIMLDAILRDGVFYVVDIGNRLQNNELSKHLFKKFAVDYLDYRMGKTSDVPAFTHGRIIQRYFKFEKDSMFTGSIPDFTFIKEFTYPKKYIENSWNEKAINERGFAVVESPTADEDFDILIKYMKDSCNV